MNPASCPPISVRELRQLAADANLEGSVRQRIDPLLEQLPASVAATTTTAKLLGLDRHESAYLLARSWARVLPPRHGVEGGGEFLAYFLRSHEEREFNRLDVPLPFVAREAADITKLTEPGPPGREGWEPLEGLDRVRFYLPHITADDTYVCIHPSKYGLGYAPCFHWRSDSWQLEARHRTGPWPGTPTTSYFTLDRLPTAFLLEIRPFLSSDSYLQDKHPNARMATQDLARRVDEALAARNRPHEADIRDVVEAFLRGDVPSLVGQLCRVEIVGARAALQL
jgi:hypothetical protein